MVILHFIVAELCGTQNYGYSIKCNGQDEPETKNTNITLSKYSKQTVKFSVKAFIEGKASEELEKEIKLCQFESPNMPDLVKISGNQIIPEREYEFKWVNPNENETCGVKMNYTYNVSVTPTGKPDKFKNVTETSTIISDLETGTYTWKVVTSNGVLFSETAENTIKICVPKLIP